MAARLAVQYHKGQLKLGTSSLLIIIHDHYFWADQNVEDGSNLLRILLARLLYNYSESQMNSFVQINTSIKFKTQINVSIHPWIQQCSM